MSTRGVLADVRRLEPWLHVVLVLLTVTSAARYVQAHGLGRDGAAVLAGAALLLVVYAGYARHASSERWAPWWCAALVTIWFVLVVTAPSFAWCAVPMSFVALRVLRFAVACVVVGAMVVTVVVAWTGMRGLDLTIVVGPACIAVLAVGAYRALEREAALRQALLDDLTDAQGDLADAQHRAGVLAERARLSREIHDSVAQGLSSINLLLQAAEQDWTPRPEAARRHVGQAAMTARDALVEVRRVVRDLAAPEVGSGTGAVDLPGVLREACERAALHSGLAVDVRLHGDVVPVSPEIATALVRTARGAVANVVEHAAAATATVTLTFQGDQLLLDVRDDGRGFDPARVGPAGGRGRGLAGIRARVAQFGGELTVESAPGEGTALAVSLPLGAAR